MSETRRRQPKGLYVLFLTEMWERFGFYTTVYLLVLYLTQIVGMDDRQAYLLYGAYTSFIYLTMVGGGFLADRLLGFRRAIKIGAVLMCAGYLLLSLGQGLMIYVGLATLTIGSGFFKPNVSSLLGQLYDKDDDRRESGFTIFYMGINIGAFAATLGMGYIATDFGYRWAFALAGLGKVISLLTFVYGQRYLQGQGQHPEPDPLYRRFAGGIPNAAYLLIGVFGAIGIAYFLLKHDVLGGEVLAVLGVALVLYFLYEIYREDPADRRPLIALLILILFSVVFWAVYAQQGLSVILFIERSVDRSILGHTVPPSSFGSLNPLFILLLAPMFSWLWVRLTTSRHNPSVTVKFILGIGFLGTSFFVLHLGGAMTAANNLVSPIWLVLFFLLLTIGEMCLSPVGLAMVTRLTPTRLLGFAMGMWFLATAVGNYLGGVVALIATVPKGTPPAQETAIYEHAFADFGWMAVAGALLLLSLVPVLHRLMANRGSQKPETGDR